MAYPYHHSPFLVRKWSGKVGDYLAIRSWFDTSKAFIAGFRHRAP